MFTVVSDPPDDDDEGDCVDVAYASVDFQEVGMVGMVRWWCGTSPKAGKFVCKAWKEKHLFHIII